MIFENTSFLKKLSAVDISTDSNKSGLARHSWWTKAVNISGVVALISWFFDPYFAYLATSWLIFGLLSLSLDLVWGRGGVLSLGQTAFYGLGNGVRYFYK